MTDSELLAIVYQNGIRDGKRQRKWASLTDDEIKEVVGPWGEAPVGGYTRKLIDKIDEALKRKNHD